MKGMELIGEGPAVRLRVLGAIDETAEFPDNVNCDDLVVDFENLTTFNSFGVRLWLVWLTQKRGFKTLRLENCRSRFLSQATHVSGLIPHDARVESFYVPFFDVDGDVNVEFKMVRGRDFTESSYKVPELKNANGTPLELDVEERYFAFLKIKR